MTPPAPETFWPPPPAELRAWRRRAGIAFVAPGGLLIAIGVAVYAVATFRERDLGEHLRHMLPVFLVTALPVAGIAVLVPRLQAFFLRRVLRRVPALVKLDDGESLLVLCPGVFLDAKIYRPGLLAITDRRFLRVAEIQKGVQQALLAGRDELAKIEVVRRRATGHPVFGAILAATGLERGLWLETRDQRASFFVTDMPLLDPLVAWLEGQGLELGHRDDADLAARPTTTPPAFAETEDPATWARNRRNRLLLILWLVFCAAVTAAGPLYLWLKPRSIGATSRVFQGLTVTQRIPVLPRPGPQPPGDERILEQFSLSRTIAPGRFEGGYFQLVRLGGTPVLRHSFPHSAVAGLTVDPRATSWEPLGASTDTDDALLAKARARLQALGDGTGGR